MASKSRTIGYVIVGLAAVGLLGFGTGGLSTGGRTIGSVGDIEITRTEYVNALQQTIARAEQQFGTPISFPQALSFELDLIARNQLISQTALEAEAQARGLSVGDDRIRDVILAQPAFQLTPGEFDRERYRFELRRQGLSEADYEDGLRLDRARTLLQAAVSTGIPETDVYGEIIAGYLGQTRDVMWVTLTEDDLADPLPAPSEEDLTAWYEANADALTEPERKRITYAWISPGMLADEVELDEESLRDLYESRIDQFIQPERRLVERLVFPDMASAEAASQSILSGEAQFETVVEDRGITLSDIDLGDVALEDLGAAGEAVFATEPGNVTAPINTDLGPALFRMNAVLDGQEITFDDARPDLREELAISRARRMIEDSRDTIDDLLVGGATLEDVAAETDMILGQIDYDEGVTEDIASYQAFREAAAILTEDDFPEPIETEDGGLFAIRLDETVAPRLPDIEEVMPQVTEGWRREALLEALEARAETVAQALEAGEDTALDGLTVDSQMAQARQGFLDGTPPAMIPTIFETAPGNTAILPAEDTVIVLRVDAINEAATDDEETAAQIDALASQGAQAISDDILTYFTQYVVTNADRSINEAAVTSVHSDFSANAR